MPSSDIARVLASILHNIELARRFTEEISFEQFENDQRTIYAVTRCLEIISEASRRLPDEIKARHPRVPWSQMAGAGNIYRHDYEDVLPTILWTTVKDHLQELEDALRAEGR